MSANSSISLSNLDFDTLKETLKSYLKSQDKFKDYDFSGSNINVLLDILSYNTFHNSFYLSQIGNEMFLDTAQLRDSVVSHAKELNYTPRSFKSAEANVNITVVTTDLAKRSIAIPKGTSFTSRYTNKNYTFSTNENIVLTNYTINDTNVTFTGENIVLYEGYYVNDSFTYTSSNKQRFILTNKNVDISSISATVIEDVGGTTLSYSRAQSLFEIDSDSTIFFIQGCENDSYEVIFGDGVTGRKPKDNSVIVLEYRTSSGQLPNGCNTFLPDSTIDGESNITVATNSAASGGSVSESIESIKYNAPRHFTTQERAVTAEDYENLLKINYPEINTVSAYGGENLDPPQFGKVFVAVDLVGVDGLPQSKREEYYRFLKPRSPVSIDPVFVNPEYTYIGIDTSVNYNINTTRLTQDDIKTLVSSAIINYAQINLNNFNRVFRYSKAINVIDEAAPPIISNETIVKVIKVVSPTLNESSTFDVKMAIALDQSLSKASGGYTVQSSRFTYKGQKATIQDDGEGILYIVDAFSGQTITNIGSVDYTTGLLQFSNFIVTAYEGSGIKIYTVPATKDIQTINNVILNIIEEDIDITVVPVRV